MTELAVCGGQQGDWLIDVTIDGKTEKLPSAHRYFLQGLLYSRPAFWLTPKRAKKGERYIEALRKHRTPMCLSSSAVLGGARRV